MTFFWALSALHQSKLGHHCLLLCPTCCSTVSIKLVILLDAVNRQSWYTLRIVLDKVFAGEDSNCGKRLEALTAKLQQKHAWNWGECWLPPLGQSGLWVVTSIGTEWALSGYPIGTEWDLSGYLHWDRVGFERLPPLGQSGLWVVTSIGTEWALSGYLHWDRVGFEWLPPLGQSGLWEEHIQLEFSTQKHLGCRLQCWH